MAYEDAKHRPHAVHTGEEPRNPITYGPESLSVTLDRWGPQEDLFTSMYDALQANWGDAPSRTVDRRSNDGYTIYQMDNRVDERFVRTGWGSLAESERDYIESCFAGRTLQQVLEGVTFDFTIDGVARAFTHQNVRTRLGAGFMQHGGRDNDWRHRAWTMPETMRRMCVMHDTPRHTGNPEGAEDLDALDQKHCITNWEPIDRLLGAYTEDWDHLYGLKEFITEHLLKTRQLYAALVDAGIPWQDARRVLPIGMQTYIHDQYNYLALQGVLANRLEHVMDWEFNCVAQLMLREIKMKCPPLLSKYLGSHSDKAKQAKFAGLESWPPDGKYPNPYERCKTCGHSSENHVIEIDAVGRQMYCEVCARNPDGPRAYHSYEGVDSLPRQHRPEQMPFFVLHPDSMKGGPIVWIPTNGKYPHDQIGV